MFPNVDWHLISLELFTSLILVALVICDILLPASIRQKRLGLISCLAVFGLCGFWLTQRDVAGITFGGMFVVDSLAWFFKGFFLLTMIFIFPMTEKFFKSSGKKGNEFYFLLWLSLIGMCLIASAADFLVLFIALEILTISLYVMTAYLKSDKNSLEAGMKYLILGSLASGFFLYGLSFLYGVVHTTRFEAIQTFVNTHAMSPVMLFALVLIFSAAAFKIAAFPFHMWVPDVYQGAPTPVTALLSVGSKAAGFVILIRLFASVFASWQPQWSLVLAALAAVTMTYGNLVAMFQTNIKRLLGYSSIGHAGYLMMGIAVGSVLGISAINFYLVGYLFATLAAFFVVIIVSKFESTDQIADYSGLSKRSGILAATLLLALTSLAGMPPLAGFFGKFLLLLATVKNRMLWLALIAAANIVISLYYYLLVIKKIYVDAPQTKTSIPVSLTVRILLIALMIGIVGIGICQGPFFNAAITAVKGMYLLKL